MPNNIFKKLQSDLRLVLKKNKQGQEEVLPGKPSRDNSNTLVPVGNNKVDKENSELKKLWNWWISNTYDSPESFKNRWDRYTDLQFAYYNDPIVAMAVELLSDETVQSDSNDEYIQVFAKDSKLEKAIKKLFKDIGMTPSVVRSLAFNVALFGDGFWINSVDEKKGVTSIIPVSVFSVKQRLEFSLAKAAEERGRKTGGFYQLSNKKQSIEHLYKVFSDKTEDVSYQFEPFLFGYELEGDLFVGPWSVTHFRRFSAESEFFPFGRPPYIHMISPYRQYSASLNLQAMARVASFPLKHFKVKTDETMTEIEKWNAVSEAQQEYANLGVSNTGKDEYTINDELWTPDDLLDVDVIESRMDIDKVADIELLQDRLLIASRIPKGYLPIGSDNNWGESGKSLIQQSKIFGRMVYTNQQAILTGLVQLVKLHFTLTGEFIDPEFEISMPFPTIEESQDRLRMKNDSLRLANDIISNFGQALGMDRGEALPIDIVQDIFSTYSFLDPEEVEEWVDIYNKSKEEEEIDLEESKKRLSTIRERYFKTKEVALRNVYFDTIKKYPKFHEGVRANRHYINSNMSDKKSEEWMIAINSNNKKLKESGESLFADKISSFVKCRDSKSPARDLEERVHKEKSNAEKKLEVMREREKKVKLL